MDRKFIPPSRQPFLFPQLVSGFEFGDERGWYDGDNRRDPLSGDDRTEHYLLTPDCRTFPMTKLMKIDEAEAYAIFCRFRWPDTDGEPVCPRCGCLDCYDVRRRRFRCSGCGKEFSVTSGTLFAWRKLSFWQILAAIWLSVNSHKGKAALQVSRELGVQYKTAWVLAMKVREALGDRRRRMVLHGSLQMDGKYAGGHVKPANKAEDRVDRRLKENRNGKRLCVLAIRETGEPRGMASTYTRVVREEDANAAWQTVSNHVARGKDTVITTDEHPSYDDLVGLNDMRRINHSEQYQTRAERASAAEDGRPEVEYIDTNQIESFFSRIERSLIGIHHRFSVRYLDFYAAELAWREDSRHRSNREQVAIVLLKALGHATSKMFCGYWQGNMPQDPDFDDPEDPYGVNPFGAAPA